MNVPVSLGRLGREGSNLPPLSCIGFPAVFVILTLIGAEFHSNWPTREKLLLRNRRVSPHKSAAFINGRVKRNTTKVLLKMPRDVFGERGRADKASFDVPRSAQCGIWPH